MSRLLACGRTIRTLRSNSTFALNKFNLDKINDTVISKSLNNGKKFAIFYINTLPLAIIIGVPVLTLHNIETDKCDSILCSVAHSAFKITFWPIVISGYGLCKIDTFIQSIKNDKKYDFSILSYKISISK